MNEIPGLLRRTELSPRARDEMFALFSRHFEGVTRERFEADLDEKNWVVEIRQGSRLVGFSTILAEEVSTDSQSITAIYSGDTIVAPEAWNSPALPRTWISAVNFLRARNPGRPCHWLLLTGGFRTYRFLPLFWKTFYPNYVTPTPPGERRLLEYLASRRYGRRYESNTGVVRFDEPQRLRGHLSVVPPGRQSDRHVSFFLSRNPGHSNGDELACLTEIDQENLTPAGRRMVMERS